VSTASTTPSSESDRELEEWEARAKVRAVRRVRIVGALASGAAFLAVLIAVPDHERGGAWALAFLAAAAVVGAFQVAVRLAARPGRPEPGRLVADYLVMAAGATTFAVLGYPAARLLGLLGDRF
jgi:hypothetical protein